MNAHNEQQPAAAQEVVAVAYWRVTFRMYRDDPELCALLIAVQERPTLDSIGVTPRPLELANVGPRFVKQHRWDQYGERCLDCGDKDWMNDPVCRPRMAEPSIEATPSIAVNPSTEVAPMPAAATVTAAPGIDLAELQSIASDLSHSTKVDDYEPQQIAFIESIRGRLRALIDASPKGGSEAPQNGEVLVTVSGLTGSGKSAVAGEIEILCKALGLEVEWTNGDEEKYLTHADWTEALELYKPRVRIVEINIPRVQAGDAEVQP